jgi:hypothetical protein
MIRSLIPYLILALGSIASVLLFATLKREIHRNARKHRREMEELASRLRETSPMPASPPEPERIYLPVAPRSGFNLNKRTQAMRMLRRGEDLAHVAAALGVPRKEVELLIRVQGIVAARVAAAGKSLV